MFSAHAFERFIGRGTKFDMVFIDGSHDYAHVAGDISMYRQLLRPNGILCGHDFNEPTCPDVARAVLDMIPKVEVTGTIWCATQ